MDDPLRELRVLVVDDEPVIRSVFRRSLTRAGVTVYEASTIAVARDLLMVHAIDIVLTDLRMPGGSGAELIHWIRARLPTMPIVLVSGFPEDLESVTAELVLSKPIGMDVLKTKVAELVRARATASRAVGRP